MLRNRLNIIVVPSLLLIAIMILGLNSEQIRALLAGFICMLIYGSAYTYGTVMPYLYSYIYYYGDSGITSNVMAVLLPISIIILNLGMPLNNIPKLQFSNRITTLISIIGVSVSVSLMSFGNQFWHVMVFYGILYGMFIGFGYMAPIKNCYEHIPDRKGLCSGVCILGYGIASLLFNMILQSLINPNNEKMISLDDGRKVFSTEVADNVPFTLRIMSLVYLGIGIVGIVLMKPPTQKRDLLVAEEQDQKSSTISKEDEIVHTGEKQSLGAHIWRKKIQFLTLTLSFSVPFGMFVAFNYKEYGSLKIEDDSFLTAVGSCGAIFNGLGRLIFGMLFDKFSFKFISTIINLVLLIFSLTLSLLVQVKFLYLISVSLIYFVYGGNYSIYPTQTVRVFGSKLGPKVYYIVFFGFSVACLIQYFSRMFLVPEDDKYNGFKVCFYIFAGFNVASLLLGWFVNYDYEEQLRTEGGNRAKQ